MQSPFISVVIPTYNSEKYITETLETVFNQTYSNYEVIVSDDGSADNTVKIIKNLSDKFPHIKIKVLLNEHEGPGAARNKGVEAANGEWISFLDSDDKWLPHKLQKVTEIICLDESIDLIGHNMISQKGIRQKRIDLFKNYDSRKHPFLTLFRDVMLATSTLTIRKKMLLKAGLFDTTLPASQDYDLWLRLSLIPDIRLELINEALSIYVTRHGNISSNIERQLHCMLIIGRKYYKNLKGISRFPYIEKLKYEGQYYAGTGLKFLRRGNIGKGIMYFVIGICKWPFVFDKLYEKLKK